MNIDVLLTAAEANASRVIHRNVAIIDVFRATTVMTTALDHGVTKIIPVITVEQAFDLKERFAGKERVLLCGEREMVAIDGFDKDNSPYAYMDTSVNGATMIMTTTNGTRAINNSRAAANIYIAAMVNCEAASLKLMDEGRNISLVCSGQNDRFTMEDGLCAGMMIEYIKGFSLEAIELSDTAILVNQIYLRYKDNVEDGLKLSYHYNRMMEIGLDTDIEYSLRKNITQTVPCLTADFTIVP